MVLSKRERQIAITVGGLLGVLLVYSYVIQPFFDQYADTKNKQEAARKTLRNNHTLFNYQRDLKPAWTDMSTNLTVNDTDAQSQAYSDVYKWGQSAGVTVSAIKPDRVTTENKFVVSSFHVTASGHMASITRFVWALESAPVPMRVHEVQLKPKKEGTDDLEVQLSVSTLSLPATAAPADGGTPPAAKPASSADPKNNVSRADAPGKLP